MNTQRKLPAYPLFVKDPNFSLWSVTDALNGGDITAWFGERKPVYGFLKADGETYCFLGDGDKFKNCNVKKAEQISVNVTAFTTNYEFTAGKAKLNLSFVSPLPPDNLELLAQPVCYLEYSVEGVEKAELSLFVNRAVAYNVATNRENSVRGGVLKLNGFESAVLGLKRQQFLSNNDDLIGADWGYFYLGGEEAFIADESDLSAYLAGGYKSFAGAGEERFLCAVNRALCGIFMLGYDDIVSIDYFGDFRKGYYLQDHTVTEALEAVWRDYKKIDKTLSAFDKDLKIRAQAFGKDYYDILTASLRQSVAAHKLIKDGEGNAVFLSKECGSNGCIATVDVSYPSVPLYLIYNTELVKGMMRPILKVAHQPVWTYDFAPHDAGTYPHCCGNVYGLNKEKNKYLGNLIKDGAPETHYPYYLLPEGYELFDYNMQMPVEECANMLVMFAACYKRDGDSSFFAENRKLCAKWVEYLVKYGLKPGNQLCTDDFAGHLENNLNLAIKSVVGIGAYAMLVKALGDETTSVKYRKIAEQYAGAIVAFSKKFAYMPLTWDTGEETFALKYNFAFDRILGLNLFPQELLEREVDFYLQAANAYGTPLDSREIYTKSDWICWAASLTDDRKKAERMIAPLKSFLRTSLCRVPFSDWYDTDGQGEMHQFRARSVQGGCFILLLND